MNDELGRRVFKNAHVLDASARARLEHTFSGVYFPIRLKTLIPTDAVLVHALEVRGQLGELSVYTTEASIKEMNTLRSPQLWKQCYGPVFHAPSWKEAEPLMFDTPVVVKSTTSFYVHSRLPGDQAIIYDNARTPIVFADDAIEILSGVAHISSRAFEPVGPWGGIAFRDRRAFVGKVVYSYQPLLWTMRTHVRFPVAYKRAVVELVALNKRADGCVLARLPRDVLLHVLSYLAWDDFLVSTARGAITAGRAQDSAGSVLEYCPSALQRVTLRLLGFYALVRGQMF